MIDTYIYNIEGVASFYVVGTPHVVNNLLTYLKFHADNETLNLTNVINYFLSQKVYCHAIANYPVYFPTINAFKKAGRWISIDGFAEACYLAHPEIALEELPFSLSDVLNFIINDNPWIELFDVDKDEVIKKLQEHYARIMNRSNVRVTTISAPGPTRRTSQNHQGR